MLKDLVLVMEKKVRGKHSACKRLRDSQFMKVAFDACLGVSNVSTPWGKSGFAFVHVHFESRMRTQQGLNMNEEYPSKI